MKLPRVLLACCLLFLLGVMLGHELVRWGTEQHSENFPVTGPGSGSSPHPPVIGTGASGSPRISSLNEMCVGTSYPPDGRLNVTINGWDPFFDSASRRGPEFVQKGLHWQTQVESPGVENFEAQILNPTNRSVMVGLHLHIAQPDGCATVAVNGWFLFHPWEGRRDIYLAFHPWGGLGKYCFMAKLAFGDPTGDGGASLVSLSNARPETGCFHYGALYPSEGLSKQATMD